MDANGTRYQLLLGPDDWLSRLNVVVEPDGYLAWDTARSELTLQPRLYHFAVKPAQGGPSLDDRRGAGRDRFGNWYWIGPNRDEILINASDSGTMTHFWSATDPVGCAPSPGVFQPLEPESAPASLALSGLAVTEEHYLVVGMLDPAGLLVFDLHAGGTPLRLPWPAGVAFAPFDMAAAPGGGVWILDRQNASYWALDRGFRVPTGPPPSPAPADPFQPVEGGPVRRPQRPESIAGVSLGDIEPVAIEALPDGTALILTNPPGARFAEVARYDPAGRLGTPASTNVMLQVIEEVARPDFQLIAHDFAFVPASGTTDDRIDIVSSDGEQVYTFGIALDDKKQLTVTPKPEYLPMRRFGGKGLVTAAARFGGTGLDAGPWPYYDFGIGWVPLVAQRRPRHVGGATLTTRVFDGREPSCVWHRLMLDGCIPPETAVRVSSRAGDNRDALANAPWQPEPTPYLRGDGTELPYAPAAAATSDGEGTWETLFQRARGRYLQLRLDITGNGRATPRLRALRAYYPRFSYLDHYLPAVYREDATSASFLDRFLANVEGFFTTLEDKIAAVQALFDVQGAPAADLDWLASWYGVALDPNWEASRRRLFLAHAMDFFQYRGTIRGLVMGLRLVLDPRADESIFTDATSCSRFTDAAKLRTQLTRYRIVETFATRTLPPAVLGDPTEPATVAPGGRWQVSQRRDALNAMYQALFDPTDRPDEFPIRPPSDPATKAIWQQFAQQALGFVPSAEQKDRTRWQNFLERRYHSLSAYNTTYGLTGAAAASSFSAIPLPDRLPADEPPLLDWFQFESMVLGRLRTAHRFRVLLPAPAIDDATQAEHLRRYELAARVLDLEKPAHTVYDVRFYWAYFRVGYARLGCDTLLDRGGRSPELMRPMILGRGDLAASYLTPALPGERAPRWFLGERGLGR
jgi:phage tail-like protein